MGRKYQGLKVKLDLLALGSLTARLAVSPSGHVKRKAALESLSSLSPANTILYSLEGA